ncbi:hypothetical protein D9M69_437190 [compost metagenome]
MLQGERRVLRLLQAVREVTGQRMQPGCVGRRLFDATRPRGMRGVEHEADAAAAPGLEVVPVARRDDVGFARCDAAAPALDFDIEHAVKPEQHLEVVVRMAAARLRVVAQREDGGGRVHGSNDCPRPAAARHHPSCSSSAEAAHTSKNGMLMRWNSRSPFGSFASRSAIRLASEPSTQPKPPTLTPAASAGRSCT